MYDITARMEADEKVKELAMVVERIDNTVIITDRSGLIEWVNQGFTDLTGYSFQEVINKKPGDFLQGEKTNKEEIAKLADAIKWGRAEEIETINYTKEGGRVLG